MPHSSHVHNSWIAPIGARFTSGIPKSIMTSRNRPSRCTSSFPNLMRRRRHNSPKRAYLLPCMIHLPAEQQRGAKGKSPRERQGAKNPPNEDKKSLGLGCKTHFEAPIRVREGGLRERKRAASLEGAATRSLSFGVEYYSMGQLGSDRNVHKRSEWNNIDWYTNICPFTQMQGAASTSKVNGCQNQLPLRKNDIDRP
ncbi:hypothetical protein BD310DRAFT_924009 [Dichomitus squalens]|uniref:Uncharacterized protein n=1 Tax=Dichomitus squalens TaxID=114155 RepID=A0A4Q9PYR6_9APHY|nr:hypothetical protein BD310DRAFT_924009 [Dichomitus squalens]